MTAAQTPDDPAPGTDERRRALEVHARGPSQGIFRSGWAYLWANKKWWLLPLVIALALLAALIVLGGTGAGPFIYTLF